jgi:hypothetical protein
MTGSITLDVVIGLIFIYTLYSLLTTTLVEMISSLTRLRSTNLQRGITRMLDDHSGNRVFADLFFKQPLIKYLGSGRFIKKPSYLSAQNFAKAVMEVLKEEGKKTGSGGKLPIDLIRSTLYDNATFTDKETVQYIRSLLEDAQHDLDKFKASLEQWYDDTMERVSSWYKNWMQVITFIVGFIVAWVFNVDTIKISRTLSHDPKAREQYIVMATALSENTELANKVFKNDTVAGQLQKTLAELYKQGVQARNVLSMERDSVATQSKSASSMKAKPPAEQNAEWTLKFWKWNWHWSWSAFPGWLITAFALSLGAPFWFDLLNKVVKLRGSVKIPSKSEPNKDPNSAGTTKTTINPVG